MIHLFKMINGKLVFVDYGVLQHRYTYELQGYYVRVVHPMSRRSIKPNLNITITHHINKAKVSLLSRIKEFVNSLIPSPELCYA